MIEGVEVREIALEELDEILYLDRRFRSSWSKDLYRERLEEYPDLSYGAYLGKRLVGFVLGKRNRMYILISRIVVDKEFEGTGIGSKLLEALTRMNVRLRSIIRISNLRSLNLHLHRGFAISDCYTYSDGDIGFILERY